MQSNSFKNSGVKTTIVYLHKNGRKQKKPLAIQNFPQQVYAMSQIYLYPPFIKKIRESLPIGRL